MIAYMPTPRTITVNMAALKGPATAKWFDPTSGTYPPITESPLTNVAARQFTPPGKNHDGDWVLLPMLRAATQAALPGGVRRTLD